MDHGSWFRYGSAIRPSETYSGILRYEEAYDWYTDYGENGNAEAVYDRYNPDYNEGEARDNRRPNQIYSKRLRSGCCDMGRLIKNLNSRPLQPPIQKIYPRPSPDIIRYAVCIYTHM